MDYGQVNEGMGGKSELNPFWETFHQMRWILFSFVCLIGGCCAGVSSNSWDDSYHSRTDPQTYLENRFSEAVWDREKVDIKDNVLEIKAKKKDGTVEISGKWNCGTANKNEYHNPPLQK